MDVIIAFVDDARSDLLPAEPTIEPPSIADVLTPDPPEKDPKRIYPLQNGWKRIIVTPGAQELWIHPEERAPTEAEWQHLQQILAKDVQEIINLLHDKKLASLGTKIEEETRRRFQVPVLTRTFSHTKYDRVYMDLCDLIRSVGRG